jgi:hypothetical protein
MGCYEQAATALRTMAPDILSRVDIPLTGVPSIHAR